MRSEPELGRLFNESRQKIRRSLDVLVEQGYLTRKHGSGTFVRKVYPQEDAPDEAEILKHTEVLPEQVFMPNEIESRHAPEQKKHRLRIGIPGDSSLLTKANQLIFSGAETRLKELDHKAVMYSHLNYGVSGLKTAEQLADEFGKLRCDGYIFECLWADLYSKALKMAFGDNVNIPITYVWAGSIPVEHEPLIQQDTNEAVTRAVSLLAANGYSRIGLICMDRFPHPASIDADNYTIAMQRVGLDYRAVIECNDMRGTKLKNHLTELWKNNRPDALYVADDHFLPELQAWMKDNNIKNGKDIKIITLWNKNGHDPGVSRLEFDPRQVGILAVDNMIRSINLTEERICSFSHQAKWIP